MRALLQLIRELLWPVHASAPGDRTSREACLKLLAILMIALIAGPDIFAATELTTILELFGATMFMLSFAVGFWMLGLAGFERLRGFVLPVEHVALIQMRGKPLARIHGASLVFRTGVFLYCGGLLAHAWISELLRLLP